MQALYRHHDDPLLTLCHHGQIMSQAIKRHARIGKPIIITETGIADGVDTRRELWATSYLKAVSAQGPVE